MKVKRSLAKGFDHQVTHFITNATVSCVLYLLLKVRTGNNTYREVLTTEIHNNMVQMCQLRNDDWGFEVLGRLQTCGDLRAADARYHTNCHKLFTTGKDKPSSSAERNIGGRPVEIENVKLFNEACDWLEQNDDELFTAVQLHERMIQRAHDPEKVYSVVYLKKLLLKRYGDHLFFASVSGCKDVICLRDMASHIINDQWYVNRDMDVGIESE
jgi:hypothetical protein